MSSRPRPTPSPAPAPASDAPAPSPAQLLRDLSEADRAELKLLLGIPATAPVAAPEGTSASGAPADSEPPVRKRTPLDTSTARQITFIADIAPHPKAGDTRFVDETLWFKGVDGAKGPQGGVYCYGRAVVGTRDHAQKGILKIASRKFQALEAGGTADAWVRFDGASEDVLIGTLTGYRVPSATRAASRAPATVGA